MINETSRGGVGTTVDEDGKPGEAARIERLRVSRARPLPVTARAIGVWAVIALFVSGVHLSFFGVAFRESWYAPLHFLWVVACASVVSWLCVCPCERKIASIWLSVLFVAVSCGITWGATRVPWGGAIVGEKSVPLPGVLLICAELVLVAVSALLASSLTARSEKASDSAV